jgi:hypothetical protein
MPSPQTPLPERARGFENLQLFLAPLLLLWEKGLGDEGKRFVSQSECSIAIEGLVALLIRGMNFMGTVHIRVASPCEETVLTAMMYFGATRRETHPLNSRRRRENTHQKPKTPLVNFEF